VRKNSTRQLQGREKSDMAPPVDRPGKRRRLDTVEHTSQAAHERHLDEVVDTHFYDPDQDINERRALRKGLRDLNRNLNGSSAVDVFSTLLLTPC
jgi:non-structural maintenance of chromosomes element 4